MGLDKESFGTSEKTQIPWVVHWAKEGFSGLKRKGWGFHPKRGIWALTPKGISKAQSLSKREGAASLIKVETIPTKIDPYLVGLLTRKTPCFGFISETSGRCRKCLISKECKVQHKKVLSGLVLQLSRLELEFDTQEKLRIKAQSPESKALVERVLAGGHALQTCNSDRSLCYHCLEDIPKGDHVFFHPESGYAHVACLGITKEDLTQYIMGE
jgi:hypothetical protein